MLNRLLDPTANNKQIEHEDEFVDIEGNTRYSSRKFRWWYVLLGIAVLFPYISIFVLFGLVGKNKDNNTTNNVSKSALCTEILFCGLSSSLPLFSTRSTTPLPTMTKSRLLLDMPCLPKASVRLSLSLNLVHYKSVQVLLYIAIYLLWMRSVLLTCPRLP